ncbi:MAG: methylenetetrahydrofolate reductase [NAD(P)H] [Bacteroidales bacterium]|nr:methylenetetrahydrofolate reductase [NAD(P)H] [Bacteroidales bacterium]
MKIIELFNRKERTFSFEFFPPKDEISAVDFGINVGQLLKLDPSFVSVTYGAGGSTQERTFTLVDYLQNKIGLTTMAHYTCVNATHEKVVSDINHLKNSGIENLMLLRGDPPKDEKDFFLRNHEFRHASDLITLARTLHPFSIGAAAYTEKHPESPTLKEDLENMLIKFEAGTDFLITQMFFDNETYYKYVTLARNKGINCRIIPGIIPITNYRQINKFITMTGATIPDALAEKIMSYKDNPDKIYQTGLDFTIQQCIDLLEWGAPGIHFYTLNKSRATIEIYETLPKKLKN